MDTTNTPALSDGAIERFAGDPVTAQAVSPYAFGECIGRARGMSAAREIYEPLLRERDARIDALEVLAQGLVDALASLKMYAAAHSLARIKGTLCREALDNSDAALSQAAALGISPKQDTADNT